MASQPYCGWSSQIYWFIPYTCLMGLCSFDILYYKDHECLPSERLGILQLYLYPSTAMLSAFILNELACSLRLYCVWPGSCFGIGIGESRGACQAHCCHLRNISQIPWSNHLLIPQEQSSIEDRFLVSFWQRLPIQHTGTRAKTGPSGTQTQLFACATCWTPVNVLYPWRIWDPLF